MEKLLMLATNVNWGYNSANEDLFIKQGMQMYNYVLPMNRGGRVLTELEGQTNTQVVGFAFSHFAIYSYNGDDNVNSVAAENAYYCLAKSIKAGNNYAAPELFKLLDKKPQAILDKFVSVKIDESRGSLTGVFSYYGDRFRLQLTRQQCMELITQVKYYLLTLFFDVETCQLRIPKDVFVGSIDRILSVKKEVASLGDLAESLRIGRIYFDRVYSEIQNTLFNI